ncbi:MAG: nuclear transport factor 2 family protein [Hyphomonadaceae bacterium]
MATPQELMQLGSQLVEFCNQGKEADCQNQMYADNAVSVEATPMPGADSPEAVGLDAIKSKSEWWFNTFEVHSMKAEGPFVHGDNQFSVIFDMDTTNKETGERTQMRDIGQYTVNDGQIVREEFSYTLG